MLIPNYRNSGGKKRSIRPIALAILTGLIVVCILYIESDVLLHGLFLFCYSHQFYNAAKFFNWLYNLLPAY